MLTSMCTEYVLGMLPADTIFFYVQSIFMVIFELVLLMFCNEHFNFWNGADKELNAADRIRLQTLTLSSQYRL